MIDMLREISLLRKTDEQNSGIVTEWLENNIYNRYVTNYSRITDFENQVKGIDCTFIRDGKFYKCDEKAAVAYINRPLYTFSFELSFIDKYNSIRDGWLINDDVVTDIYCLVWIDKAKTNVLTSINDIEKIETAFVQKEDILRYLKGLGWSKKHLIQKMNDIRENDGDEYMGNVRTDGCKFSYSPHLVEKPINILIPRRVLRKIKLF